MGDWLLKLRIVSAMHLLAFSGSVLYASYIAFPHYSRKKETIWCWLSTGLAYTKTIEGVWGIRP